MPSLQGQAMHVCMHHQLCILSHDQSHVGWTSQRYHWKAAAKRWTQGCVTVKWSRLGVEISASPFSTPAVSAVYAWCRRFTLGAG